MSQIFKEKGVDEMMNSSRMTLFVLFAIAAIWIVISLFKPGPHYTGTWTHQMGSYVIEKDGTGVCSTIGGGGSRFTWQEEGDHIKIGTGNESINAKLSGDGNSLIFEQDNNVMIFVRK